MGRERYLRDPEDLRLAGEDMGADSLSLTHSVAVLVLWWRAVGRNTTLTQTDRQTDPVTKMIKLRKSRQQLTVFQKHTSTNRPQVNSHPQVLLLPEPTTPDCKDQRCSYSASVVPSRGYRISRIFCFQTLCFMALASTVRASASC